MELPSGKVHDVRIRCTENTPCRRRSETPVEGEIRPQYRMMQGDDIRAIGSQSEGQASSRTDGDVGTSNETRRRGEAEAVLERMGNLADQRIRWERQAFVDTDGK